MVNEFSLATVVSGAQSNDDNDRDPRESVPFPLFSFLLCCPAFIVAFTGGFLVSSLDATQTQVQISFKFCGDDGEFNCKSGEYKIAYVQTALFIGAILGALTCRIIAEQGRKLLLCSVSFFVIPGSILAGLAPDGTSFGATNLWWLLIVGRFISGIGMGFVCVSVPLFVGEVTPNEWRGNFNSLQFLMQSFGSFVAVVLSLAVQQPPGDPRYSDDAFDNWWWRVLLMFPVLLSIVSLLALSLIDETPYCLVKRGLDDRALAFLTRVHGDDVGRSEFESTVHSVRQREKHVREVRPPSTGIEFVCVCVCASVDGGKQAYRICLAEWTMILDHGTGDRAADAAADRTERQRVPPRAVGGHRARRPAESEWSSLAAHELIEDLCAKPYQPYRISGEVDRIDHVDGR